VWGKTPQKALENAIALEYVAQMQIATLHAGSVSVLGQNVEPVGQVLLDKHFKRKHGTGAYYGQAESK
jgi:L-ribulose-5-phosphate 4-epimerase